MSYTDHAAEAADRRREAKRQYHQAWKNAERADAQYRHAARIRRHVAWLTQRPDLWGPDDQGTPASWEGDIRSALRLADTYLRSSFAAAERSAFYRDLARRYDEMAATKAARLAEATS